MPFFETGAAETGLGADNVGRKFVSGSDRPLGQVVCEERYYQRNPFFVAPSATIDSMSPATVVFRYAPSEKPAAGTNAAPRRATTQAEPLAPAWLAQAQGIAVYRGNAFPPGYMDTVFIPDPKARVVHHAVLNEYGIEVKATRAADEKGAEFLWSKSPCFQPVQAANGPDGALYVVDRQEGSTRGRIYRVVPAGFKRADLVRLGKAGARELVASLASTNGWTRDTGARLLFERQQAGSVYFLTNMLNHSALPLARLHAMRILDGLDALDEELLRRGLGDADARVREHAIQISEKFAIREGVSPGLASALALAADDSSARVRHQLALSLGELRFEERIPMLAALAGHDAANPRLRAAIFSSLTEGGGSLFALLADDAPFRATAAGAEFLRELAAMIGLQGQIDEVAEALDFLDADRIEPLAQFELMAALGEGLHRANSSIGLVDYQEQLEPFWRQAFATAVNPNAAEPLRNAASRLLRVSPLTFEQMGDWLISLSDAGQPDTLRDAALYAMQSFDHQRIADAIIANWRTQSPALRARAMTTLLGRDERIPATLTVLESDGIPISDLTTAQMNFLRTLADPALRERALRLLGPVPGRQPVAMAYFEPALKLRGAAERGREIFLDRCVACHRLGSEDFFTPAQRLGPDLTAARATGREKVLNSIVEPNAEVSPNYTSCVVRTLGGEIFVGIEIVNNASVVGLALPDGSRVLWSQLDVASATSEAWSMMTEFPARGLTVQSMADLLDYIMTAPQ